MRLRERLGRSADGASAGERCRKCGVRVGVLGYVRRDICLYGLDAEKPSWFHRCHV